MLQLLSLALALLVIVYAFNTYQIFSKRLAAAKQSGFKIVKLPSICPSPHCLDMQILMMVESSPSTDPG